ncbi:MAG: hypothetical protein LH473_11605 [Chitinophagales bacterium]|nr:hypothetical protein [Chitinophagales bacterium]
MLKKFTAILLMTVACAILLGHNIVPHHHHDNDHNATEHHHTHHHHDDDTDREDLNHLFAHFTHSADGLNFTTSHHLTNTFSSRFNSGSVVAILPDNFGIIKLFIPPLLQKSSAEHLIYISPHSLSSGLRAPPAFIG